MLKNGMKTIDMAQVSLLTALLCVIAPFQIPVGEVPITLATMAVVFISVLIGWQKGIVCCLLYLLIGACGVPVFSGFSGGFPKLIGVTGGYLLGYIPCAFLTGLGADGTRIIRDNRVSLPVAMLMGTFVLYLIGTVWFMALTGSSLGSALSICVVPFLPGDGIKILAVSLLALPVRKAVYR